MTIQHLLSPARRAVDEFKMIDEGDRVAVGLSGGKDSITLLHIMSGLKRFYPKRFELFAFTVDMGFKDTDKGQLERLNVMCEGLQVPYTVEKTDIAEILFDIRKESNPCSLCSKLRRGSLNTLAAKNGCNKLALGHHADDLIETFFLSLFYEGRLSTFSPLSYMSRSKITLIRPMIYIREQQIASFAADKPILHNPCPADKHTKRESIKDMLKGLEDEIPGVREKILSAISHPERYNLFDKFKNAAVIPAESEES